MEKDGFKKYREGLSTISVKLKDRAIELADGHLLTAKIGLMNAMHEVELVLRTMKGGDDGPNYEAEKDTENVPVGGEGKTEAPGGGRSDPKGEGREEVDAGRPRRKVRGNSRPHKSTRTRKKVDDKHDGQAGERTRG